MPQELEVGTNKNRGGEPSKNKLIPFLSYSKSNKAAARDFAEKLRSEGWIDPWFDEEDILPGQIWQEKSDHWCKEFSRRDNPSLEGCRHIRRIFSERDQTCA